MDREYANLWVYRQLLAKYDGGDHLHPNGAGYIAMADAVDLSIFSK